MSGPSGKHRSVWWKVEIRPKEGDPRLFIVAGARYSTASRRALRVLEDLGGKNPRLRPSDNEVLVARLTISRISELEAARLLRLSRMVSIDVWSYIGMTVEEVKK